MKILIAALAVCGLSVTFVYAQEDWVQGGVDGGGRITLTNARGDDVAMLGIDVRSSSGGLMTVGSGPFLITLLDTPDNVVLGNLGAPFLLATDATVKTDISFNGVGDLTGTWGRGRIPTPIEFNLDPPVQDGQCTFPLGLSREERTVLANELRSTSAGRQGLDGGPFYGLSAPLISLSPTADGVIGKGEYPNSCSYDFADRTNPARPVPTIDTIGDGLGSVTDDLSLTLHLAHTREFLFLGFQVTDDFLDLQRDVRPFSNDSVELFINADVAINDFNPDTIGILSGLEGFQIVADAAGDGDLTLNNRFSRSSAPPTPLFSLANGAPVGGEFYSAGRRTNTGWNVEFQIPLGSLDTDNGANSIEPARTDDVMLMNFAINDNDILAGGQQTHAPLWLVEGDQRAPSAGGENVWPVPLKLTRAIDDPNDCNGDGLFDAGDLTCTCASGVTEQLLNVLNLVRGDVDADGTVGLRDFIVIAENFGTSVDTYTQGDLNCSGAVRFDDFLVLVSNFGKLSTASIRSVPEPSSSLLAVICLVMFGRCRFLQRFEDLTSR